MNNEELQSQDILIGDMKVLDHLATRFRREDEEHPLQEVVEDIVREVLSEDELELFFLRFGENLPFRQIAKRLGYSSHRTFQVQVNRIIEKVRRAVEEWQTAEEEE